MCNEKKILTIESAVIPLIEIMKQRSKKINYLSLWLI